MTPHNAQQPNEALVRHERLVEGMLAELGLQLSESEMAAVIAVRQRHADELDHLREVQFDYFPDAIEPAMATRWIEHGGRAS